SRAGFRSLPSAHRSHQAARTDLEARARPRRTLLGRMARRSLRRARAGWLATDVVRGIPVAKLWDLLRAQHELGGARPERIQDSVERVISAADAGSRGGQRLGRCVTSAERLPD